jgi:hypothetical protein
MAVKFTENANAASYLATPAEMKDGTVSFWLKFNTLPPAGTAEMRQVIGLVNVTYTDDANPDNDAFPFMMALIGANDVFYEKFAGRPALEVTRAFYYWGWDLTDAGNEIDIADGQWHHHCFVSRSSSGALDWYIDGVLQRPADAQVIDSDQWTGDWRRGLPVSDIKVGTEGNDYGEALAAAVGLDLASKAPDGPMAEVAVWGVAIGASDIAKLASGAPASMVRQNDLISYQRLFEGPANFIAGTDGIRSPDFGLAGYAETIVSSPSSSHVVAMPAEAAEGQVALLIGTTFEQTFSTPAGWSLRETNTSDGETSVLTKTLTAGDLAGVTVSCAGSTRGIWHVYVFNDAQRPPQIDLMETDLEVGERAQFDGSNCIKIMYARTRRTDNTLAIDSAYDEVLSSETAANVATTAHGRLVTGYRGPEWDQISDEATATITGTTDGIRAGIFFISAAQRESGMSDGVDIEDHPPAVMAYVAEIESRVFTVKANGRDTGDDQRHDPDARLDYAWDWSDWLRDGEFIASSETEQSADLTVSAAQHDGQRVFIWVEGGSNAETYPVTCRITTNQGRTDDRTMRLFVLDR